MKTKTKRRNNKVKSSKAAGRKTTTRSKVTSRDYPIAETLRWVADGEKLLRMWGAIKSPTAKRISGRVAKVLPLLETINEIRKI